MLWLCTSRSPHMCERVCECMYLNQSSYGVCVCGVVCIARTAQVTYSTGHMRDCCSTQYMWKSTAVFGNILHTFECWTATKLDACSSVLRISFHNHLFTIYIHTFLHINKSASLLLRLRVSREFELMFFGWLHIAPWREQSGNCCLDIAPIHHQCEEEECKWIFILCLVISLFVILIIAVLHLCCSNVEFARQVIRIGRLESEVELYGFVQGGNPIDNFVYNTNRIQLPILELLLSNNY